MENTNGWLLRVRFSRLMSRAGRIKNLAIETLVAAALVTGFVVYLFKSQGGGQRAAGSGQRDWKWFVQIGNTAIVFGYIISWFRHAWKRLSFWTVVGALLLIHGAAYVLILRRIQHLGLVYYALFDALELVIFTRILSALAPKEEQPRIRGTGAD
jgi:hypothetical protein